ncbi:MAG: hypothetical protein ACRENE_23125 [Polyangiaceae bacterium]
MRVELSSEAEAQALYIDSWWRGQRRASPDLFESELDLTIERVAFDPKLGTVYEQTDIDETVYRVLMPRTHHHVYYVLRNEVLFVLAVWGAVKERGPRL